MAELEVNFTLISPVEERGDSECETHADPGGRGSSTDYSSHAEPDFIALQG